MKRREDLAGWDLPFETRNPSDFRMLREHMGLSDDDIARACGDTEAVVADWQLPGKTVPRRAWKMLNDAWLRFDALVRELSERGREDKFASIPCFESQESYDRYVDKDMEEVYDEFDLFKRGCSFPVAFRNAAAREAARVLGSTISFGYVGDYDCEVLTDKGEAVGFSEVEREIDPSFIEDKWLEICCAQELYNDWMLESQRRDGARS